MNANLLNDVDGAAELEAWFGYWPTFHDAEVMSLTLERKEPSRLRVRTWHMANQVDECGRYVLSKHIVVSFILDKVTDCDLGAFNHQNVLSSLRLEREPDGFKLILDPCFGLNGSITAEGMRIELESP